MCLNTNQYCCRRSPNCRHCHHRHRRELRRSNFQFIRKPNAKRSVKESEQKLAAARTHGQRLCQRKQNPSNETNGNNQTLAPELVAFWGGKSACHARNYSFLFSDAKASARAFCIFCITAYKWASSVLSTFHHPHAFQFNQMLISAQGLRSCTEKYIYYSMSGTVSARHHSAYIVHSTDLIAEHSTISSCFTRQHLYRFHSHK